MMCTTISPASTSTHSPDCSPSTPTIVAPAFLSASRTCCDSAFTCRGDSAVAMISESYRVVSLRTSRTTMSRALMSSRAVTAVFWILLSRIRKGPIKLVAFNICQNSGRKQSTYLVRARRAARESSADRARRNIVWRYRNADDRAASRMLEACCVGGKSALPLRSKWRRQGFRLERYARSLDHEQMGEREKLLPLPPLCEPRECVGADHER